MQNLNSFLPVIIKNFKTETNAKLLKILVPARSIVLVFLHLILIQLIGTYRVQRTHNTGTVRSRKGKQTRKKFQTHATAHHIRKNIRRRRRSN